MAHGDQRGLVIPPVVAPTQVVIVPIAAKKGGVMETCTQIKDKLVKAGIRVNLDDSDNSTGWKFNEWEMCGVPIRIEVGPRDLEEGKVVMFRRDTCTKEFYTLENLTDEVSSLLKTIQSDMLEAARVRRDERIIEADDVNGILAGVEGGNFVKAGWCGNRECEDEIKAKTAASARVFAEKHTKCTCAVCSKKALHTVIFARAY
jgi:prolyl-tRNA synthetase